MEYVRISVSGGVATVSKMTKGVTVEINEYDIDGADESLKVTVDEHGASMIQDIIRRGSAHKTGIFDGTVGFCGRCGHGYPIETMHLQHVNEYTDKDMGVPDYYLCALCKVEIARDIAADQL